jgi:transcription antitermination factor NusG
VARAWYVIHTYSGHEDKVKASLEKTAAQNGLADKFHKLLIPTEDVVELRRNKRQVKKRKFFPGYVLVDMDVDNQTYWMVRNTAGVTGFLGGVKPTPLPESEISSLLQLTEAPADQTTINSVATSLSAAGASLSSIQSQSLAQDTAIQQRRADTIAVGAALSPLTGVNSGVNAVDNSILTLTARAGAVKGAADALAAGVSAVQSNMTHLTSSLLSYGSYKNKLINGDFGVWQRGSAYSGTIDGSIWKTRMYLAPDRWFVAAPVGAAVYLQKFQAAIGSSAVNACSVGFAGAVGVTKAFGQLIESATTLQGRAAVLSFWARGSSVNPPVAVTVSQGATVVLTTPLALTTNWTQYTVTMSMPTVSSAPGVGRVEVAFSSVATWNMDVARVQFEEGSAVSEFEYRPPSIELSMCQRYYETGTTHFMGYGTLNNYNFVTAQFKADKVAQPATTTSISIQSGFSNNVAVIRLTTTQITLGLQKASNGDGAYTLNWTADSELT